MDCNVRVASLTEARRGANVRLATPCLAEKAQGEAQTMPSGTRSRCGMKGTHLRLLGSLQRHKSSMGGDLPFK